MKKAQSIVIFFLLATSSNYRVTGQDLSEQRPDQLNTITTAVPFLIIAPDARAGAMGDAGVASTPDGNSIHWNPAKLAFIEKDMGFAISYTPWLRQLVPDINLAYLSGYKKIDKNQAFGASLLYFSLGDITFTDVNGNTIGQFKPNEFSFDASYSRKLGEEISGGIALRYIYSNLTGGIDVLGASSHPGTSLAADLSAYYEKPLEVNKKDSKLSFGLNISNIGAKISYTEAGNKDFIPINLRLGSSLRMMLDQYNEVGFMVDFNKLLVPTPPIRDSIGQVVKGKDNDVSVVTGMINSFSDAPDGLKEEFREVNLSVGFEYWYDKQFAIRAGYFHEHPTKGNRKYFTIGAGLKYNVFGLDFAYLIPTESRNPLENTLRFSLLFDFEPVKSKDKPE
jgi:hypothetical protein